MLPVRNIAGNNISLYNQIRMLNIPINRIKTLYGDIGVDIYEGRKPSILSEDDVKKSKKLINRLKTWLTGKNKLEYDEKDSIHDVILKYMYNKKFGKNCDIENKFGAEGLRELSIMRAMGYVI